ncbi:hypothetical protein IJ541_04200 [bacterium]|nr:hypothetical protein [bacterium]
MKIKHLTPRKLERLMQRVYVRPRPEGNVISQISVPNTRYSDARINLESCAEHMDPQAYIYARNYISRMEMNELLRTERF